MEVSVLENRMAARQQKTDANYLPVSAVEQNKTFHDIYFALVRLPLMSVSRFRKESV